MTSTPKPPPDELARRRAEMLAWIQEQRRRGYVLVSVACLSRHRIGPASTSTGDSI